MEKGLIDRPKNPPGRGDLPGRDESAWREDLAWRDGRDTKTDSGTPCMD
jgi:hypothetical protein